MVVLDYVAVITCSTFEAALNHIGESDVILMEVEMPNMDGYGFLQHGIRCSYYWYETLNSLYKFLYM